MTLLRSTLEAACAEEGCSANAITVLAPQNDPFRVDTLAATGTEWLAVLHKKALELKGTDKIHFRGLHYALFQSLQATKPDGTPYQNTDADWQWLQNKAGKAARWLGYIPFEEIFDARNSEPVIRVFEPPEPWPFISVGVDVAIPSVWSIQPRAMIADFYGLQPYKLAIFGEKTSLEDVLTPIAESYQADLYLPAGEISDTLLYRMAKVGADDGRRMVVFTVSDCDPAGWQMPVSIARKLQALKALEFPDLNFEVRPIGLTPDQVREYGLPSTPLKETERRADKWVEAMGVQQTEIDSLTTQPELLRQIVRDALRPFYEDSLAGRVTAARRDWEREAQARLDEQIDQDELERLRIEAKAKLDALRGEIDAINDALRIDATGIDLPDPVIPDPILDVEAYGLPLIDSDWRHAEQSRRLIEHKSYGNGNGNGATS